MRYQNTETYEQVKQCMSYWFISQGTACIKVGEWQCYLADRQSGASCPTKLLIPLCLAGAHLRRLLLQKTLNGTLVKRHVVSAPTALMKSELRRRILCVQRGLQLDTAKKGGEKFRRILESKCRMYRAYLLSLTWAPQLSQDIEVDAGFLCDRSVVLWWGIEMCSIHENQCLSWEAMQLTH